MTTLRILIVALLAISSVNSIGVCAQSVPYALNVTVEASPEATAAATILRSKAAVAAQSAGIAANPDDADMALFETVIRVSTLTSRIVRTPEPRIVLELQVDVLSRQVVSLRSHGTMTASLRGIGRSESDALVSAVRAGSDLNRQLQIYYEAVNQDIASYFEEACPSILQNARVTAAQENHHAAIYALSQVPPGAEACWTQSQDLILHVIEQSVKQQCAKYIMQAKAKWRVSQSRKSAQEVAEALAQFYPGIQCDSEVDKLLGEVTRTIAAYDRQAAERHRREREHALELYYEHLSDHTRSTPTPATGATPQASAGGGQESSGFSGLAKDIGIAFGVEFATTLIFRKLPVRKFWKKIFS